MSKSTLETLPNGRATLRDEDFLALGMNTLAYMKPIKVQGRDAWSVHAADGTPISVLLDRSDVVAAAVRQHDMDPVSVH